MTKFYCYSLLQQWRYNRLLRIPCFLQHRRSSSVMKAPAALIPNFDSHAYARLLQLCTKNNDPNTAKTIHCDVLKRGNCLDLYGRNILLNLYLKTGLLSDGLKVFDEMPERNVVSFVTMIQGYSQFREYDRAVDLFFMVHKEGHELNPFVFTTILKLLVSMDWLELALCVHACIYKLGYGSDAFVGTSLIDAYSVFGAVNFAKEVFKGIVDRDMVCWTGMVSCYAENDCFEDSLDLFNQMRSAGLMPNNYTFASVIKACLGLENAELGKSIHGCIIKTCYEMDSYVGVSLLDLYTRSGDIEDARHVFEEIPKDDVVPWSFMISRYSQSDRCQQALDMFIQMRKAFVSPNEFTLASILQACATKEDLELGSQAHCHMVKVGLDLNVFALNALMDVYAKCGNIWSSMELFVQSTNKNEVSWNTMIVGYVQLGDAEKAFLLYLNMLEQNIQATEVTYSSLLRAAACLAALEVGIQIHSVTVKTMYDGDDAVSNALIDMYGKCGRIRDARSVFDSMSTQDVISWNSIISAYSMHGLGDEALKIFEAMRKANITPDPLTFVAVLSACSNTGSMDQGESYFTSMQEDYGIEPRMEHYTCMVSLLGRLGYIDKAVKMIGEIPHEPSVMVWRALLGACVAHNNVEFGRFSAEKVLELEPQDESTYVLLSNIYAGAKRWDNVAIVRKRMKRKKVKKEPGLSWVEIQGMVHSFVVGDNSHEDIKLIRAMLEWLNLRSKRAGYAPNHDVILLDVEEDEKSRLLWSHSERIALAFSLLVTPPGSPIRIIKNLRICADCHVALKLASKLVKREIVVRDIKRFHHFHDGICSCNDYW
ncbi:putative pentatricopeptide repeat-containing protein At5g13230, mitochondrial [Salvia hispanica]|uniref:putative pentatricopeptide repeat-containing protein At5g13230, mitochondrial n=1 Tax=Salvia hispanica TaxID=49212 RepID=UPI0020095669|nr:putative pentatricopeptide repeat-containing protein At5g13230, mitochondrial [Salvia hispanica]XP_047959643.1 putative pentatricopeptide repeat-containing protein At5g13230, mitochondrial [Salvia hispanica]XP_047959644.1 putative pentatricopeptide repeat-containing protein At5g13230, mitochondrial [Salvia hispanica]XP_047959645.1 putative pentatricopeptide repeat-containing protein At5g13230, mitochondrial [Salvia hispanica]